MKSKTLAQSPLDAHAMQIRALLAAGIKVVDVRAELGSKGVDVGLSTLYRWLDKNRCTARDHQNTRQYRHYWPYYTPDQIELIANFQHPSTAISTRLVYAAGLKPFELYSLKGLSPGHYAVTNEKGFVRDVVLDSALSSELESYANPVPIEAFYEKANVIRYYSVSGGFPWLKSFNTASKKALGWTEGTKGARGQFLISGYEELRLTMSDRNALRLLSDQMGGL